MFQHTAARRRLQAIKVFVLIYREFQHTAARRRLQPFYKDRGFFMPVSTHSRAEAAA